MEKNEEIIKYIKQALEFNRQGKTREGIDTITKLIELEPNWEVNYYNRGVLYGHLEDWDNAIADYSKQRIL